MADRTLHSNAVTFMDYTDFRTIEVYIANNLPNVQIFNPNDNTYSPDWTSTNLILTASVFLDAQNITQNATLTWYTKDSSGTETQISSTTNHVISGNTLTIKSNELSNSITAYICKATYQSIDGRAEVSFVRTQAGINGTNGNSAPTVIAQYSVNGASNWVTTLDSVNHKFIRLSYNGGNTWTSAIKIAGDDGTSVVIKGTAYYNGTLSSSNIGQSITLYTDSTLSTVLSTSNLNIGDSYIVQGYLCVFAQTADKFVCTGTIQGPQGNDGISSYTFIRYADNASGTNMSVSPFGKNYIGIAITTTNTAPTSAGAYTWSKYVGDNAKSIILNADTQVFKITQNNAITPSTISVIAQAFNTTVTTWTYSVDGGKTYLSTAPTGVSRSGNVVTITCSTLASNSLTIKASDGTYNDVLTVYKAFDGANGSNGAPGSPAPLAFLTNENITFAANAEGKITGTTFTTNVVAYNGTTKVTPVIGSISGLPTGMTYSDSTTVGNELILSFTIANNATLGSASNLNGSFNIPITSPVTTSLKLNWSKVNSGHEGNGISSVAVSYGTSTSASTQPTSWQLTIPTVVDGSYLWTRTITDYTDPNVADTVTYTYAKQGTQGQQGSQGSSITVSSIQYQQGDSATAAPAGTWSNNVVSVADGKYLWTKTTFSDSKVAYGVARQGVNGIDGDPGDPASLVTITPSALYFKSNTGKDGTFTPEYIYLYPRFQTVSYSNWQYSINGGTTWFNASNANGLTIGTYNSVANSLRINRSSTLYTDSITSISFMCNSNNSAIYDIVSIAKIYDVVDIDTGWITLNTEVKYRKKNGWVCVVGQCSGSKTLTQNDYTTVGKLPVDCCPDIQIPFTFHSCGNSVGGISSYVSYDGDIQMYTTESGKNYWMFSVTFPI